jgi:O-antigen/teichoic acid export membrane protein
MSLYVALKLIAAVPFMMLRVHERASLFALAATSEALLLIAVVAFQLVVLDAGLEGIMVGYVISAGGSALLLTSLLVKNNPVRIRLSLLRPLAKFGAPLALAGLASVTLNAGDRFILKALTDAELVAVYGLAAKYGGLINMLFVQSFNMAFSVIGLKALSSGVGSSSSGGMHVHRRTFRHYIVLTGWGVLGVSLLARDVTEVLSPTPAFLGAEPLVLPIALGFMAYGVYFIGMNILYADGRTPTIAIGVALAATLNIALNLFAIPRWGAMGAALATLVAYVVLAAGTLARAHRVAPVRYRWDVVAAVLCMLLGLWALGQVSGVWETALRLPFRLALIGCYPLLVIVAGLYSREELRELFRRIRRFFGRSEERSLRGSTRG